MINYKIEGNVQKALNEASNRLLKDISLQIKKSSRDIVENAQDNHKYISRTGNLDNSIQWEPTGKFTTVIGLDTRKAPYSEYIHEGTKSHKIKPINKQSLRFVGLNGRFVFSKGHTVKGIKKDQFIFNAFRRLKNKVDLDFKNIIEKAF